jgi:thiol-disulfide isomerase/thioredoxin
MSKTIFIYSILISASSYCYCQNETVVKPPGNGIHFEEGLTWDEIKIKAKRENKDIFVDCYASWCGPCKEMEKNIYPLEEVGNFFNEHFVSVKVQMDRTDKDDGPTRNWYDDAKMLFDRYLIQAYPTFLFLSADEKQLNHYEGGLNSTGFLEIAANAIDPEKQLYRMSEKFRPGTMDTSQMKSIARMYKWSNLELSEKIIFDYLDRTSSLDKFDSTTLVFLEEFNKSQRLQSLAFKYLNSLTRDEFGQAKNLYFALAFAHYNLSLRGLLVNFLQGLSQDELGKSMNLKVIRAMGFLPEMQGIAVRYLKNISLDDLAKADNLDFAASFAKNGEVENIANSYIQQLTAADLADIPIINFVMAFTKRSQDPGFKLIYSNVDEIDNKTGKDGYAERLVRQVIKVEEIQPAYKLAIQTGNVSSIKWRAIGKVISKKYNVRYAKRCVLEGKALVYGNEALQKDRNWPLYIKYNIELLRRYGTDTTSDGVDAMVLNNFAWDIFIHSDDNRQLLTALQWMEGVVRRRPVNDGDLDTYANILYKAGRKDQAIQFEEKALKIVSQKNEDEMVKCYEGILSKMKMGQPTWL